MLLRTVLPVLSVSAICAACASNPPPPPAITYDQAKFKPALALHDPAPPPPTPPIPIGTVFGPLPPLPDPKPAPAEPPAVQVAQANRAALHEPSGDSYINAAQVYPYSENALYRLYAAPGQVSDIALQPGETLSSISAGDPVRWAVGDTSSGNGKDKQVHVLVKPFAAGLTTDLVILTDHRTYHLKLASTAKTAMAAVSWSYPADSLITTKSSSDATPAALAVPIDSGIVLTDIQFRYAITGDSPPWRPLRAFDDGKKVYIEFPDRIDQGEAPPLFVVGPDGSSQLVNYRMRANYYIVDRLFGAAELRLGQDKQQVVRISRTDGKPAPKGGGILDW